MTKARDIADGVDTADIADGAISTAKLADNSINATKLDVSGNGTAGQVLASDADGTFSWADSASPFAYNSVSGTTPSLDVGTYNFFDNGTLTGSTTLSFTNVPTEARWQYTAKGAIVSSYDLGSTSYTNTTFNLGGQTSNSTYGYKMSSDGSKFYVNEYGAGTSGNSNIYQYNLSTNHDLSTATYSQSYNYGTQTSHGAGIYISPDGDYWYVVGISPQCTVYQYSMSTAFDITTSSYQNNINLDSTMGSLRNVTFKPDGTKMYATNASSSTNAKIRQYSLSTAWNPSTATYDNYELITQNQSIYPYSLQFNDDGTELYVATQAADTVFRYDLSSAYDLSTASYSNVSFAATSQTTDLLNLDIYNSGSKMLLGTTTTGYIYDIGTFGTLTLPASVQSTLNTPTIGTNKVTYDFYTADGGTNVYIINEDVR